MKPNLLVVDENSIPVLISSLSPTDDWFESFATFDKEGRINSGMIGDVAVISSAAAHSGSRLLVVNLGEPSTFERFQLTHKKEVFRRILVAALSAFTSSVAIPRAWGAFHHGSRTSFHALPIAVKRSYPGADTRIESDRNPFGNANFYVYNFPSGWSDLTTALPNKTSYQRARSAFAKFLQTKGDSSNPVSNGGVQLSDETFFHQENSVGYADWYESRLTARQRTFVDAPLDAPIRLRGAAGTGKTLALAVKLLVAAQDRLVRGMPTRFLFLTHSAATSEAIQSLLASLDNEGILDRLRSTPGYGFTVSTLLELAMEAVGSDLQNDGVLPLATDSRDGRVLQLELIEAGLRSYSQTKDWSLMKGLASPHFVELVSSEPGSSAFKRFAWEVMNEFACVLDADGVQSKPALRKHYLSGSRQAWMMPLTKEIDRQVVLDLYDRFNREMSEMNAISIDQIISDYLNFLESFRWNAVRNKRGFDVVFVDELHLFNRQERMVLHGLTRSPTESPGLFMAYDAKQAPSDTFMPSEARESSSTFWGRLNVGSIQKVELDQVFRYTPEIASFIASLDQAFPALDLGEEWGEYNVSSSSSSAEVPSLTVLKNENVLYANVMERARTLKRKGGQRFTLAVLCCNPDRFDTFRHAGTHKKNFISISSRDEAGAAKVDAFRFILSTPEYVAGLQFDCVLLLDLNKSEIPAGPYSAGTRRKFISTVYLGASRAKRHLELYSVEDEGGPTDLVDSALSQSALRAISWSDLPGPSDVIDAVSVATNGQNKG